MNMVRITDVITNEYSDFLSFCSASGKTYISELTNIDFVAFRTSTGQTREYVKTIKSMLNDPATLTIKDIDSAVSNQIEVKQKKAAAQDHHSIVSVEVDEKRVC